MTTSPKLLDTHIHLWPSTAVSPTDHGWMTPGHFLAKRHGVSDYNTATSPSPVQPSGFIYVETDRYLPPALPEISTEDGYDEKWKKMSSWAKEPLEELRFLKRIVEGKPQDGDGFKEGDGVRCKGLVIWAPFHLPTEIFSTYYQQMITTLGKDAWKKVVGFRYLLQGRSVEEIRKLVEGKYFVRNLRAMHSKAFDIGVDCHRDGVEALEIMVRMVERVRQGDVEETKRMKLVLNHLCKPGLSSTPSSNWSSFDRWKAALSQLAADPNVYMKLSGVFNEFTPSPTPAAVPILLTALRPYLDHILEVFGVKRIMFGSDWPVCNVGGPKGEEGSWEFWREVVEGWVEEKGLGEEEKEWIWWRAGCEAYGLDGV